MKNTSSNIFLRFLLLPIVNENLAETVNEVQYSEVVFLRFPDYDGNIHSETYSLLIDTYVKDEAEKDQLFRAIEVFPAIKKKANGH